MKIYLVESIQHGEYWAFVGVFSSKEKAQNAINKWNEENDLFFEPHIREVEIDKYYG